MGIGTATPNDPLTVKSTSADETGIALGLAPDDNDNTQGGLSAQAGGWIGLLGYNRILFLTNGGSGYSTKMIIDVSGKVGIGTTSPKNKLDIEDSAVIGASYSGTNTAPANGLLVEGNVGIGTASPGYRLDVDGTIRIQNGWRGLKIEGSGSDPHRYDFIVGDLGGSPSNSGSFSIYDNTASAYRFAISKTGNVGIGTMNAGSYKLAVKGKIRAEEVVVETGWSDFVFEDDYNLMPLPEVESYIAEHQHLPDVPSAEEVAANGLALGESQALLLQKVEELTLYMIDPDKENQALNRRIASLENGN